MQHPCPERPPPLPAIQNSHCPWNSAPHLCSVAEFVFYTICIDKYWYDVLLNKGTSLQGSLPFRGTKDLADFFEIPLQCAEGKVQSNTSTVEREGPAIGTLQRHLTRSGDIFLVVTQHTVSRGQGHFSTSYNAQNRKIYFLTNGIRSGLTPSPLPLLRKQKQQLISSVFKYLLHHAVLVEK